MKILFKLLKYLLLFVSILIVYALITVALSYVPVNYKAKDEKGTIPIYILTNGVHTDIVTPYQNQVFDWSSYLDLSLIEQPIDYSHWVSFGWGDKGFYLQTPEWKDLKASVALKAAFYLSSSAMHVTYYQNMQEDESCKLIWVTDEQYKEICQYILDSFDTNANRFQLIETDQNYGKFDVFYEAKGRYSLFYTCNTWANDALKAGSQKASLFTLWDKGIFFQYK